jgi:hypothetical protein
MSGDKAFRIASLSKKKSSLVLVTDKELIVVNLENQKLKVQVPLKSLE